MADKGIHKRDIARNDPPHPAPHHTHVKRHRYSLAYVMAFDLSSNETNVCMELPCCDKPANHPIHTGRYSDKQLAPPAT